MRPAHLPRLLGGAVCLDFVNTVDPRGDRASREYLTDYAALVKWARRAGALSEAEARRLERHARADDAAAGRAVAAARRLRESIYRLFVGALARRGLQKPDLARLNAFLMRPRVIATPSGPACERPAPRARLELPLARVAESAAALLVSPERARVRECASSGPCGWLFLDRTKNGSRRYCSTQGCGNRERARRHYARQRGG